MLLDTAAELLDEQGIEGVTTSVLAERAEVSIGSVYRFFPDRISLLRALAGRNLERFVAGFTARLDDPAVKEWTDAVDVVVDTFVEMHRTVIGFRQIRFGDVIDEQLLDGRSSNNELLATSYRRLLIERFGVIDTPDLGRQLEVVTEIADGLLTRAFLTDPEGDPWFIEECVEVVTRYMRDRLRFASD